jgi:hypothetical protein
VLVGAAPDGVDETHWGEAAAEDAGVVG